MEVMRIADQLKREEEPRMEQVAPTFSPSQFIPMPASTATATVSETHPCSASTTISPGLNFSF